MVRVECPIVQIVKASSGIPHGNMLLKDRFANVFNHRG
jgi:hypothetical protein